MVHGVHRRHHREQHLRGADVAGRLLSPDVLLPGLQREPEGLPAGRVFADPDQSARQLPLQVAAHCQERGVRAAESQRHAEPLGIAERDVRAELPRRGEQGQCQQICGERDLRLPLVGGGDQRAVIAQRAGGRRVGHQDAEEVTLGQRLGAGREVGHDQLDTDRLGPGGQHGQRLRQGVGVHHEAVGLRLGRSPGQRHRLGGGSRLVEHRCVGDVQAGQVGDGGLEVEQGLQAALRDLWLVRRVRGVPGWVLQDVAPDHRRGDGVVVAEADHRDQRPVPAGQHAQFGQRLGLGGGRRQIQLVAGAGSPKRRRDRGVGQRLQVGQAEGFQQDGGLRVVRADVPVAEVGLVHRGSPSTARPGGPGRTDRGGRADAPVLPLCHRCLRASRSPPSGADGEPFAPSASRPSRLLSRDV